LRKSDAAEETEQKRAKRNLEKHHGLGSVACHMHPVNLRTPVFVNSFA
jgi:hypothetical protein